MPDLRLAAQIIHKSAFQHPGQVVGVAVQQVQVGAVLALQLVQQTVGKAVEVSRRIVVVKCRFSCGMSGACSLSQAETSPLSLTRKRRGRTAAQAGAD